MRSSRQCGLLCHLVGDGLNFLGGVADGLQSNRKGLSPSQLGDLGLVSLYCDDIQVREVHYSVEPGGVSQYRVRVWLLGLGGYKQSEATSAGLSGTWIPTRCPGFAGLGVGPAHASVGCRPVAELSHRRAAFGICRIVRDLCFLARRISREGGTCPLVGVGLAQHHRDRAPRWGLSIGDGVLCCFFGWRNGSILPTGCWGDSRSTWKRIFGSRPRFPEKSGRLLPR